MNKVIQPAQGNKWIMMVVLPLFSCIITSVIGLILGQIGNLFFKFFEEIGICLSIPVFLGLFLITFGVSFLSTRLVGKWLVNRTKT